MSLIDLEQTIDSLRAGELVALPTETVYGLAGRIDRESSLRRIFEVKSRPFFDPLIVHVHSVEQAKSLTTGWHDIFEQLAFRFWPGPLTLVLPKNESVSPLITSGLETVAVRSPAHPLALEVLRHVGVPLAAPSANRFGRTSPTQARDVEEEFAGRIDVLDGGPCSIGVESTVIEIDFENDRPLKLKILRPGGVSREELRQVLMPKYDLEFVRQTSAASPGHLKAHYQPSNPVVIFEGKQDQLKERIEVELGIKLKGLLPLDLHDEPALAARTLYQEFRRLSQNAGFAIVVERKAFHRGENWEAVWDRLERAASLTF